MTIWNAILIGLIQGITEFLPVSSSGHLSLLSNLFDVTTADDGHIMCSVFAHLGTLTAIFLVYWQDIRQMFYELLGLVNAGPLAGSRQTRYPAARLFFMIFIASLPLLLLLPVKNMMKVLYSNSIFIGVTIILTGCLLFVGDKMREGRKTGTSMTILDAIIIGLCQCCAAVPGLSRAGTTITAGIATGLNKEFAVKFSFLLSIPVMIVTNILSLVDAFNQGVDVASIPAYIVGLIAALLAGLVSISIMRYVAKKAKLGGFAYYCWVVGVLSIILTMIF